MSTGENIILAAAAFILVNEDKPQKKRRVWVKPRLVLKTNIIWTSYASRLDQG